MSHWYTQQGEPCHFVEGKNGMMRDATLRDARKLGLVPGFSGATSILAKPGLDNWFKDQLLEAAWETPIQGDDELFYIKPDNGFVRIKKSFLPDFPDVYVWKPDIEQWKAHVKKLAYERSTKARDRGSEIHDAIEEYIKVGLHPDFPVEFEPYITGVQSALKDTLGLDIRSLEAETTFACPLGYGGMIDGLHRSDGLVLDWKTKDKEFDDKTKLAYDEHGMQLAAYRYGVGMYDATCANVFISPSAKIRIHIWEEDELEHLWKKFKLCLELWQVDRKYDSSFGDTENG